MTQRIYRVAHNETKAEHLVEAHTPAQALRHVTRTQYTVEVAAQRDLARLVQAGTPIEETSAQDDGDQADVLHSAA